MFHELVLIVVSNNMRGGLAKPSPLTNSKNGLAIILPNQVVFRDFRSKELWFRKPTTWIIQQRRKKKKSINSLTNVKKIQIPSNSIELTYITKNLQ